MMPAEGLQSRILLQDGQLWPAVKEARCSALRSGALRPWQIRLEVIEEGGVRFQVRLLESGAECGPDPAIGRGATGPQIGVSASNGDRSDAAEAAKDEGPGRNPFLPYESELYVADVSNSHVALLNKYPVVDDHLLVVTREFDDQEAPLSRRDWEALWACLEQGDALGFYNSGAAAGASQRHRHLQLVPVPLAVGEPPIPIEKALTGETAGGLSRASTLPFGNLFARFDEAGGLAERVEGCEAFYEEALRRYGDPDRPVPYNLVVTRRWFLFVPRARGELDGIPVNALGFVGALLVRDERALRRLRRQGPATLLAAVSGD